MGDVNVTVLLSILYMIVEDGRHYRRIRPLLSGLWADSVGEDVIFWFVRVPTSKARDGKRRGRVEGKYRVTATASGVLLHPRRTIRTFLFRTPLITP
ncbi:hypothetical protein KM043_001796 [Ampulex compressa]|nr:hypothetical protein KM043_001796 [Ampulex compressa]